MAVPRARPRTHRSRRSQHFRTGNVRLVCRGEACTRRPVPGLVAGIQAIVVGMPERQLVGEGQSGQRARKCVKVAKRLQLQGRDTIDDRRVLLVRLGAPLLDCRAERGCDHFADENVAVVDPSTLLFMPADLGSTRRGTGRRPGRRSARKQPGTAISISLSLSSMGTADAPGTMSTRVWS